MKIRPARPDEAAHLTALARRSKAHWGYSDKFMAACAEELTITPERIERETYLVTEEENTVIGMAGIATCDEGWEVCNMFVDPGHIGGGLGGKLFRALLAEGRKLGIETLHIDADPNARPFYERMGATFTHMTPSGSIAGREIPHLTITL